MLELILCKKSKVKGDVKMAEEPIVPSNNSDFESTKLYKNIAQQAYELDMYEKYRIFYLEPGDGYQIGSLFAFPNETKIETSAFSEMVVRQNINEKVYTTNKDVALAMLSDFQKLIDEIKEAEAPVFMPLLPPEVEMGKKFQELAPECFDIEQLKYENMHKQIQNAFDMARAQITLLTQKSVPEKWFLYGRGDTCKGLFRLWALCPDRTSAICCNKDIDKIVLPVMNHKNEELTYPEGFGNYEQITGIPGNSAELLQEYRDTDVLYIGNDFDPAKQKAENQMKNKLKKLKFSHINIERYNGVRTVDMQYFYQFRGEIYKPSFLGKILSMIRPKKEPAVLTLPAANSEEVAKASFGTLTPEQMEEYKANLANVVRRRPSSIAAKDRLSEVMTHGTL